MCLLQVHDKRSRTSFYFYFLQGYISKNGKEEILCSLLFKKNLNHAFLLPKVPNQSYYAESTISRFYLDALEIAQ
jgi:hypothetical protein